MNVSAPSRSKLYRGISQPEYRGYFMTPVVSPHGSRRNASVESCFYYSATSSAKGSSSPKVVENICLTCGEMTNISCSSDRYCVGGCEPWGLGNSQSQERSPKFGCWARLSRNIQQGSTEKPEEEVLHSLDSTNEALCHRFRYQEPPVAKSIAFCGRPWTSNLKLVQRHWRAKFWNSCGKRRMWCYWRTPDEVYEAANG